MTTRTCSKCHITSNNFTKTNKYCRDCRRIVNGTRVTPAIKCCPKC